MDANETNGTESNETPTGKNKALKTKIYGKKWFASFRMENEVMQ